MPRGLMLNDADCGFCMRTARLVPRLGVDVDSSTVQAADLAALGVDPVARRTYAWVAANRHRMPGGTAACELQR